MSFQDVQRSQEEHQHHHAHARPGQNHERIPFNGRDGTPLPDDNEDGDISISITQKMLSAISGSVLTSLLVTPLDVVRIRLQSQAQPVASSSVKGSLSTLPASHSFSNLPPNLGISSCCREVFWVNNNAQYCVATGPNLSVVANSGITSSQSATSCAQEVMQQNTFTSTLDGLRKIARNEGPRTLWRGLSPTLVMAVPANVIYFAGYDWLRYSSKSPFRNIGISDTYTPLVAGSFARVIAAFSVSPIEMFRTRMQAAHTQPRNSITTSTFRDTMVGMREMIASRGVRSLWTGITLTLWRDVPFSAFYWWGYEYTRDILTNSREQARGRDRISSKDPNALQRRTRSRSREDHTTTLVDSFVAGATSGAIAALVTTPFDVGKTRQQVVKHAKGGASASVEKLPEEMAMPKFLWHIFKQQGMSGLFKGWAARCLKVAPACAIMISSYEVGKKMAGGMNERKDGRLFSDEE